MLKDLSEEILSVNGEKAKRILGNFDFLCSFEKFNSPKGDPMELDPLWGISSFA